MTGPRWITGFTLSFLGLVLCALLSVTPLIRVPDAVITLHLPTGELLARASNWLPARLGSLDKAASAFTEFFALLILAFLCYGLGALLLRRQSPTNNQRVLRGLIWLVAVLVGLIYVATPAMLSHDIIVYANYSRILGAYHVNPYFVTGATFPQDPFTLLNYWSKAISAYGPAWILVCGFFGQMLKPDPATYVTAFRLFALGCNLLNIWLVGRVLHNMGRSARTVTLGMLLFAWNPLLLLESALGGHNDSFMLTFILAGVLLAARAERHGLLPRARGYLPAVAALVLAALVKFTALPILVIYLLFLVSKALRPTADSPREPRLALRNWRPALLILCWSGLTGGLLVLAFYGPFWLGHHPTAILGSFQNAPSSLAAENSFLRSLAEWQKYHPGMQNGVLNLLGMRRFWDDLTILGIVLCLLLGTLRLWQKPTTRTFAVISLLTMSVVLLITPWFFSWYITWLLGLAFVSLPTRQNRFEMALLAFVCTFSFSALITYLFNGNLFGPRYYLVSLFTTIPPVCAFLLTLLWWQPRRGFVRNDNRERGEKR